LKSPTRKQTILKFQTIIVLLLMCIALSILSDKFLTVDNTWNVMRQISVNIVISVGMTLVILTGGIDLSVGSILALCGAITASLIKFGVEIPSINLFLEFTLFGAIMASILIGGILGWFNGFMITKFKVPPFVATLAMLTIARGLTMLWTKGFPITGLGDDFAFLGTGWFLNVPMPVWISAIVVVVTIVVTNKTKIGRYIYAVGGNETASLFAGLNISGVKIFVYTAAGVLAGIGGLIVTSRLDSAQPNSDTSWIPLRR
jgi:ribose transport system permease protein